MDSFTPVEFRKESPKIDFDHPLSWMVTVPDVLRACSAPSVSPIII